MNQTQPTSWLDLAIGMYERLTGRNAEITYELEDMHIKVPSGPGAEAVHADWVFDGALKIRTRDLGQNPN